MCVCVYMWTEWLEEQLRLCGSAVSYTNAHLSLRITSLSMLLLQQQELWIFDVAASTHQIPPFFIFYFFALRHLLLLFFFLIRIPVSRLAVWLFYVNDWNRWSMKDTKAELSFWVKNLNVSLKERQWSTSICCRKIHLPFENMTTILDTSSWLLPGPAPFGSASVSRVMRKRVVRLDRERRACLSLREGVESCCMCIQTNKHI